MLLLLAVVAVLLVGLLSSGSGQAGAVEPEGRSLCELHRGDPAWDAICAEAKRR